MRKSQQLLAAVALTMLGQFNAAQAAAPSYTFDQNTSCGSWCYHDAGYTKLTDGVVGNLGWALNAGAEWAGWYQVPSVNITFQFDQAMNFSSVSVGSTQDNLGDVVLPSFDLWAYQGGNWVLQASIINPPSSANDSYAYDSGAHPVFTFSGLSLTTDQLRITATPGVAGAWIFVDEVSFNAAPVPEPDTWAMLLAGLGLMAGAHRLRSKNS
jgi:hypothetical protein